MNTRIVYIMIAEMVLRIIPVVVIGLTIWFGYQYFSLDREREIDLTGQNLVLVHCNGQAYQINIPLDIQDPEEYIDGFCESVK